MGNRHLNKAREPSEPDMAQVLAVMTAQHMASLLGWLKKINGSKSLKDAIHKTIEATCHLLGCDRATMFIVDEISDELIIQDASSSGVSIRIPSSAGIAGHVYTSGEVVSIPDAYQDPRFNQATDAKTGYHTTSILCLPVGDMDGRTVAVLQAINKVDATGAFVPFTKEDETLADYMAAQLGVILLNAKIYEDSVIAKNKVEAMLDIVRALHADNGINSVCFTLTERTPTLVEANRCTLYLVDEKHEELWSLSGGVQIRIPRSAGIAGEVATKGQIVNIPDAYKDPRFCQDFDKKSGFHTKTILCLPIKDSDDKVVGVLQLINKARGPFTEADEELLQGFLKIVATIISNSQLFHLSTKKTQSEFEKANSVVSEHLSKKVQAMQTFAEDVEGEEEDDDS